jgi:uncharacterized RDD family membrane protein YckC
LEEFSFNRIEPEIETEHEPLEEGRYATFQQRFGGLMIDVCFLTFTAVVMAILTKSLPEDLGYVRLVIFLIILFTYEPMMVFMGGTLGHRAMKIRVRKQKDETVGLNILQVYVRFIVKLFTGPFRGFSWVNRKKNLALHDLAAGSVVVNIGK